MPRKTCSPMSKAGAEKKTCVIIKPEELTALMRVGMKLSNGFGMSKTKLCRMAIIAFIESNDEPIIYRDKVKNAKP